MPRVYKQFSCSSITQKELTFKCITNLQTFFVHTLLLLSALPHVAPPSQATFLRTLPRLLLPVSLYSLSFAFPHFSHTVDFRLKTLQLFVNCSSVAAAAAAAAVADCVAHYVYAKLPPLHALNKFSNNYEIVKQTIQTHIHSHTMSHESHLQSGN